MLERFAGHSGDNWTLGVEVLTPLLIGRACHARLPQNFFGVHPHAKDDDDEE
jgi:hypothetical protein